MVEKIDGVASYNINILNKFKVESVAISILTQVNFNKNMFEEDVELVSKQIQKKLDNLLYSKNNTSFGTFSLANADNPFKLFGRKSDLKFELTYFLKDSIILKGNSTTNKKDKYILGIEDDIINLIEDVSQIPILDIVYAQKRKFK